MQDRQLLARHDNLDRIETVHAARDLVYGSDYAVTTNQVEVMLKPESLVLTSVSELLL